MVRWGRQWGNSERGKKKVGWNPRQAQRGPLPPPHLSGKMACYPFGGQKTGVVWVQGPRYEKRVLTPSQSRWLSTLSSRPYEAGTRAASSGCRTNQTFDG